MFVIGLVVLIFFSFEGGRPVILGILSYSAIWTLGACLLFYGPDNLYQLLGGFVLFVNLLMPEIWNIRNQFRWELEAVLGYLCILILTQLHFQYMKLERKEITSKAAGFTPSVGQIIISGAGASLIAPLIWS
jgi:hypothetical protein